MIILGLNAFGQNPSACLIREGSLVAFAQEDRFTRYKSSDGFFPSNAVKWCLNSQDLTLQDVDRIAFSWGCHKYPGRMMIKLMKTKLRLFGRTSSASEPSIPRTNSLLPGFEYLSHYSPGNIRSNIRNHLRIAGHKGQIPKIEFVEHHISHAYQSYYQSPFQDAIVLVMDGSGEENCVSGFSVRDGTFRKVMGYDIPQSLGWFYGGFTAYLGFRADQGEGKLMGMAAYGESNKGENPWLERLDKILRVTENGFEVDPLYFKFGANEFHPRFTDHLVKYITSFNSDLVPIGLNSWQDKTELAFKTYPANEYVNLAYAVQTRLEEVITSMVKHLVKDTNITNICLAGGVSMNCKAMSSVLENTGIENIFVHPAASDDGACIGAGLYIAKSFGENVHNTLRHVQLGPSFDNDEIEQVLKSCNLSYSKPDDICAKAAELLSQEKILAWFHGGLEMGARALGGRSIIACPGNLTMKDRINSTVKYREAWRPYCPSMTSESKGNYLHHAIETPFMTVARNATTELYTHAPATIHVDGTSRPQTVERAVLPKWHNLLECMKAYSGHPLLLNTSFNIRGEPIVCSPLDAIRCFYSTGLDALIVEDLLLIK